MKNKIYIDLDCTILDTIKCITQLYNEDFRYYENFVEIDYKDIKTWDFNELTLATKEQINNYFIQKRFFDNVEVYRWARNKITQFNKLGYQVIFISLGSYPNLKGKTEWINKNFPFAGFIGVDIDKYRDKSHIDMSDGLMFIDDCTNNLETSNCDTKICFGQEYEWNKNWKGNKVLSWRNLELKKYI